MGLKEEIDRFSFDPLESAKKKYEAILRETILQANTGLTNLSDQVRPIRLEYKFDESRCMEELYLEFKKYFSINPASVGTNDHHLNEAFLKGEPLKLDGRQAFIDRVCNTGAKRKEMNKAEQVIVTNLESDRQYKLFEILAKRSLFNPILFKVINVYYDEKPLSRSSFGQRCTAALVLLILLGNNPIIIDEPEGHLDSLLIANYLVGLIKTAKKTRQIIFSTHNANLVVNGDADLIYHLEMDENGVTKAIPTVLEDLANRARIIGLEGGHEAFKRRESKYFT